MPVKTLVFFSFLFFFIATDAQIILPDTQTAQEQPPPSIKKAQRWWNLLQYDIYLVPDYQTKSIAGSNTIRFKALQAGDTMQIELQEPMQISSVRWKKLSLSFTRKGDACYIVFPETIPAGDTGRITIYFSGQPTAAVNPPYDNGWIWSADEKGRPWMSIACEGSGASIWLPCKDVLYDEPDEGVSISITVPDTLVAVANGRLQTRIQDKKNNTTRYTWKVSNPINNYNITCYIGKYVNWHKYYDGLKGKLDCDFWVLDYNLEKGKKHLQQTDSMLRAFEYWMGPYPFYEDGYKLVEAPLDGMEHQSGLAYGNGFQNGYKGKDFISNSGWGLKWDFILVHESGHEWFGNSISCSNYADSWIHEGFTKYLETLYTDYVFGKEAGNDYAIGTWKRIKNDQPIIGTGTTDQYYKGSAMLHAIRQVLGDTAFRSWLIGLNKSFYHQTVTTTQVLHFLRKQTQRDFSKIFAQYLQTTQVPVFEYRLQAGQLQFRWTNCIDGFDLPLRIALNGHSFQWVYPRTGWQTLAVDANSLKELVVDRNFYMQKKLINE